MRDYKFPENIFLGPDERRQSLKEAIEKPRRKGGSRIKNTTDSKKPEPEAKAAHS